ncbi:sterol desaturase family protein [Hahella sp. CCB-MM4]|uniref:sterol desaturase family protein n=1 Tax=Hahella sp. (strain CCB-MM4) TaxID=1926491 RepID=UPI001FED3893|nr:sterol desaturase family protein [Hahella sp. CCB-MM4]
MGVIEWGLPRRQRQYPRRVRWPSNLAIVVLNSVALRLLFPLAAMGASLQAEKAGWGLLNKLALSDWASVILAFLTLDFAIYLQHRLFHRVPMLWKLHRMHHADPEIDVSTGIRFHPIEIILSMAIKMLVVWLIGAPPMSVLLFEIVLNATSLFNHSNVRLPERVDAKLRWMLVTPDYHRVHHSRIRQETDSNFGFNLPWWDRLFGTYLPQPELGHLEMQIGVIGLSDKREELGLGHMLTQPFRQISSDRSPE